MLRKEVGGHTRWLGWVLVVENRATLAGGGSRLPENPQLFQPAVTGLPGYPSTGAQTDQSGHFPPVSGDETDQTLKHARICYRCHNYRYLETAMNAPSVCQETKTDKALVLAP